MQLNNIKDINNSTEILRGEQNTNWMCKKEKMQHSFPLKIAFSGVIFWKDDRVYHLLYLDPLGLIYKEMSILSKHAVSTTGQHLDPLQLFRMKNFRCRFRNV